MKDQELSMGRQENRFRKTRESRDDVVRARKRRSRLVRKVFGFPTLHTAS